MQAEDVRRAVPIDVRLGLADDPDRSSGVVRVLVSPEDRSQLGIGTPVLARDEITGEEVRATCVELLEDHVSLVLHRFSKPQL